MDVIVVVGAGVLGLAVGFELPRTGRRATVLNLTVSAAAQTDCRTGNGSEC